ITSFAGFLFAFFVTNPYFLLAFPESLVELRQHTGIAFSGLSYLKYLQFGLGWPLLAFAIVGTIMCFFVNRNRVSTVIMAVWIIFFYLFISLFGSCFARYILPVVPALIILSVGFWTIPSRIVLINILKKAVITFVMVTTFFYGMAYLSLFRKENTRTLAGRWIKENLPAGTDLGVTEVPWQFQMAPLNEERYHLIVTGYDIKNAERLRPDYFILSSFQAEIPPVPDQMPPERSRFWKEFQTAKIYQPLISFPQPLSFLGIRFNQNGAIEDLIYLNPTITIFKKSP
ncbi:MAG: hypothetical protein V2A65_06015, partial [Candidatus Omnitrophota bacterium]